jgi:succinate dehydrogenase / fumarate reductase flavoprotein subunit
MGGLWVDYELMTTIPGLFAIGECNFSDHGANRLGASALMQGLADGYFILPYTIQNYLQKEKKYLLDTEKKEFELAYIRIKERINSLIQARGEKKADEIYRKFGLMLWDFVGMVREKEKLEKALHNFQQIENEFWSTIRIPEGENTMNLELEKAMRIADFIEIGILMARDAMNREESCGGHFRIEHQIKNGEPERDDRHFMHVSAWEYKGQDKDPVLHKEKLYFENIKVETRDYS